MAGLLITPSLRSTGHSEHHIHTEVRKGARKRTRHAIQSALSRPGLRPRQEPRRSLEGPSAAWLSYVTTAVLKTCLHVNEEFSIARGMAVAPRQGSAAANGS
jgi:hypothetical protein